MKALIILAALAAPASAAQDACPDWKKNPEKWTCLSVPSAAPAEKTAINDAEAWAKLWLERTGAAAAPAVDFAAETIVADGERVVRVSKSAEAQEAFAAAALVEAEAEHAAAGERVAPLLAQGFETAQDIAMPVGAEGFLPAAANCTPGVDCPNEKPKPQQPAKKPGCTPGVDCPAPSRPQPQPQQPAPAKKPGCTPGVDCPRNQPEPRRPSCTPGVDCAGDRERNDRRPSTGDAPLPRNYRPRPTVPPSYFPPVTSGYEYFAGAATGWSPVVSVFGRYHDDVQDRHVIPGRSTIERGGSEAGRQASRYSAVMSVSYSQEVRRLHWRYLGFDCDPYDAGQCEDWRVQYGWLTVDTLRQGGPTVSVDVVFEDDKPLLPWETETIGLSYDGRHVHVNANGGAFQYQQVGPMLDADGRFKVILRPGPRYLRAPESDKVIARLVQGAVEIVDFRSDYYKGEQLEVWVEVKKDCGRGFCFDKVVPMAVPARFIVKQGPVQGLIPVSPASGTYYITNMWFRRVGSRLSGDGRASNGANVGKSYKVRW